MARAAREALVGDDRCAAVATCGAAGQCSTSLCAWTFPDTLTCSSRPPNSRSGCAGGAACTATKLDETQSYVRVPPGTEVSRDGELVPLPVYHDICMLRSLDAVFLRQAEDTVPWAFVSTARGTDRIFPGHRREHNGPNGTCRPYDPRLRPWFASAASGPLDVVIALDASATMGATKTSSGRSRMDAAKAAVVNLLGTLDWASYVGVVRYSDAAEPLLGITSVTRASRDRVSLLQAEVERLTPGGAPT
eukprot:TRINITY_DN4523_c0_g1_i3.p1 TRINITY_DN4523_c0_g1~~TRINITY_DN4523_c0_g1_i3.p1  ORF type:complete len:267 (-),score=85.60 TRINITY_DN4523_c0_g1_i3:1793-2536(-)